MLDVKNSEVYTDFNGLGKLKAAARDNAPEALKQVAKQFESVFLNMVLKSMREAKLGEGLLDTQQSKFYQDMYDQQLAVHLSGEPGVGLADMIVQQLSPKDKEFRVQRDLNDYLDNPLRSRAMQVQADDAITSGENLNRFARIHQLNHAVKVTEMDTLPELEGVPEHFEPDSVIRSKQQFVEQLLPMAEQASQELGVEPKVLLAQAALETRWGQSVIKHRDGSSSFNLFNIKASKSWDGKQATVSTLEFEQGIAKKTMAGFRAYNSYAESFADYVKFIKENPRYQEALQHAANPGHYMQKLQQAGYATDPGYASKVMSIYHGKTFAAAAPDDSTQAMRS